MIAQAYINQRATESKLPASPNIQHLKDGVYVTEQISTTDLTNAKAQHFKTIIDFRPDGEAPDQTSSSDMQNAAKQQGLKFYYIPVAHGELPVAAANKLTQILSSNADKTLLYCRSGNRATRAYALALASQSDGPDADTILKMVTDAGHSTADLKEEISHRISVRKNQHE